VTYRVLASGSVWAVTLSAALPVGQVLITLPTTFDVCPSKYKSTVALSIVSVIPTPSLGLVSLTLTA
jgi:hypothetical protein